MKQLVPLVLLLALVSAAHNESTFQDALDDYENIIRLIDNGVLPKPRENLINVRPCTSCQLSNFWRIYNYTILATITVLSLFISSTLVYILVKKKPYRPRSYELTAFNKV